MVDTGDTKRSATSQFNRKRNTNAEQQAVVLSNRPCTLAALGRSRCAMRG
jgi:hypothetical protein